jgi:hypothetical protein
VNPHFYRLRKEAVGEDHVLLPGRATERCERDSLTLALRVNNSNSNGEQVAVRRPLCKSVLASSGASL